MPESKNPVPASPTPAPAPQPATPPKTAGGQKTILIVEDEKPLSHALEMKLKNEGFAVKTVVNGEDAVKTLSEGGIDMMLLDLIMPKLDGFGVLEAMMEKKITMPVLVLSNLGQEEDRSKAKTMGAADYFVKSNTPIAQIVTCVKKILG